MVPEMLQPLPGLITQPETAKWLTAVVNQLVVAGGYAAGT